MGFFKNMNVSIYDILATKVVSKGGWNNLYARDYLNIDTNRVKNYWVASCWINEFAIDPRVVFWWIKHEDLNIEDITAIGVYVDTHAHYDVDTGTTDITHNFILRIRTTEHLIDIDIEDLNKKYKHSYYKRYYHKSKHVLKDYKD